MDGNSIIDDDGAEIQNKENEENQKKQKQKDIGKNTHEAGKATRRRLHTWGGDERRNVETPINWEKPMKGSTPSEQRNIKKVTRPGTKTCQKVLPKKKSMIQVRANYINKINEIADKNERNEESSPLKKKMKNDNVISKKKENCNKNINEDEVGSPIPENQYKKPDENTRRKKCIDCNKIYSAERTSENKKKCLICKYIVNGYKTGHFEHLKII